MAPGPSGPYRHAAQGEDRDLEESQANFEILRRHIEPGYSLRSRFLTHPLAPEAGGDPYHAGSRRWASQDDAEWRMLAVGPG